MFWGRKSAAKCRFLLLLALAAPVFAHAEGSQDRSRAKGMGEIGVSVLPDNLKDIEIKDNLGAQLPLDTEFVNEAGQKVKFSSFFHSKKPVVLSFAYYECPMLCGLVLNAELDAVKGLGWVPGEQFEMVNVSIDPRESHELAATKKKNMIEALGMPKAAAGWHFLTGAEPQIKALASAAGFGYRWDDKEKQYAHGAGVFVLTPEGKISRILYGIQYRPQDLKLSLVEASNGKIGTIIDRIVLFCYSYNPITRKYSLIISRVMQAGMMGTALALGTYLGIFWMGQRRRKGTGKDSDGSDSQDNSSRG